MGPDLGRDLVLHNYFLELANSRPVTLILGFNPEHVLGAETSNQRWIYGPERRVYLTGLGEWRPAGAGETRRGWIRPAYYLRRLSFSSRLLYLSELALLK